MKQLLELIARSLVDAPERVEVREVVEDESTLLELRVAPEDLGKVIGKQGRTARAIRTILATTAAKRQTKVVFEIID